MNQVQVFFGRTSASTVTLRGDLGPKIGITSGAISLSASFGGAQWYASGLAGKFFNGNWRTIISTGNIGTLPLTPTNDSSNVTGTTGLPSANHRYGVNLWPSIAYGPSIGDSYGFIAIGYFTPPTTGTYTFYTSSDDGSGVWIKDIAVTPSGRLTGNAVVNNNLGSGQGNTKRSGSISLAAGQVYPIRIVHEEGGGGDNLTFSWAGPGIPETTNLTTYFKTPILQNGTLVGDYVTAGTIKHYDEGTNAANFTSNWNNSTTFNMADFGGLGNVTAHGFTSGPVTFTLTLNNLPPHTTIRYRVFWHLVDSLDNETNQLFVMNSSGTETEVLRFTKIYNAPPSASIIGSGTTVTWNGGRSYSYRPWANGSFLQDGFYDVDTGYYSHSSSTFTARHVMGADQAQADEAEYLTHVQVFLGV